MADEESEQDDLIDPLIDTTPVFSQAEPLLSHARRQAFVTDLARKIDPYPIIATRYGFADAVELSDYLRARDELRKLIKDERALWFSGENNEIRARELARRATVEMLPDAVGIGLNETVNPSVRLEAMRGVARIAGLDGPGARTHEGFSNAPDQDGRFSVQIIFPNAGRTETITVSPAPAIDAAAKASG